MTVELVETNEGKEVVLVQDGVKFRIAKVQMITSGRLQITLPNGEYWFSRPDVAATADIQKALKKFHETGKAFA